eukprot:COSAG06_NODE_7416_length_2510_cov_17.995401_1_plen_65_part_00
MSIHTAAVEYAADSAHYVFFFAASGQVITLECMCADSAVCSRPADAKPTGAKRVISHQKPCRPK